MNFFIIIPLSSYLSENWAYPYGALNILVPFLLLYYLYSRHHILLPRNVFPNIFFPIREILLATFSMCGPLISLPNHLYSWMVDTLHAYVYDPYLRLLLIFEHFLNYIFGSANPYILTGYLLLKHDNDIWLPKLYEHSFYLQYVNSCDSLPYRKTNNFIETKSSRNKLRGFNH